MEQIQYLQLLRFVIRADRERAKKLIQDKSINLNAFKQFAAENLLSGYMYPILIESGSKDLFPEDIMGAFRDGYLTQWEKNEKLMKEIERLEQYFKSNKKEVIFLKGPFFAQRFYGNIDKRFINDIDILVKEEDIGDIIEEIEKDGFRRVSGSLPNQKLNTYYVHHLEYRKENFKLELHWALAVHGSFRIDYRKIWKEKKKYTFKEKSFWVLPDEYILVLQILSIFRDIELGTVTIRAFFDIYYALKLLAKNIDWKQFFENRKKEGLFLVSLNVMDLVCDVMDCHEEFNALTQYIEENNIHVRYKDFDRKWKLLSRSKTAIRNKMWTFMMYDTSVVKVICWWAISLPVRLFVHREKSFELLK